MSYHSLQQNPKANKIISVLTAALVFLLAVGAFGLSYSALRALAADYGLAGWQSYAWPLMIDAALVVCSLAVLRANLQRERAVYPWALVGLYSLATVTFNVIHAPDNLIARLVAFMGILCQSFERERIGFSIFRGGLFGGGPQVQYPVIE